MQSLPNKIPSLEVFLDSLKNTHKLSPDIMCFTESWLKPETWQTVNVPGYANAANYFRPGRRGGAAAIFVKENLDFSPLSIDIEPVEFSFEYCGVKSPSHEIVILCIYRSNNANFSNFNTFISLFERILLKLYHTKYLIITGDFNIDLLRPGSDETSQFFSVLNMFNIKPSILTPTRIQGDRHSCIDNILVNFPVRNILNNNTNIFSGLGDHKHAQIVSFRVDGKNATTKILTRTYRVSQIERFTQALSSADFSPVYERTDVNDKMLCFYDIFLNLFNLHFPYKTVTVGNSKKKRWITRGIKISSAKKRELFLLCKNSGDPSLLEYYRTYSRTLQQVVRAAKKLDTQHRINNAPQHKKAKTIWEIVNSFSKSNTQKHTECKLVHEGREIQDGETKMHPVE
ncbi:hypothetical protein M8J76_016104 [Diaphorina citri]|nr:hypothetical protein M8J76_016104 [Diaphorina citri]